MVKLGIVGLPYSGKTSLFEAITGAHAAAQDHSGSAHQATIAVPDKRLDAFAGKTDHKKVTHAHIDFVDVAGVGSDQGRDHVVGVLSALREVDGLVHVVRFFDSPSAPPHPRGSLDPGRDAVELSEELIIADLDIVERRIERLDKQVLKATPHQAQDKKEIAVLQPIKETLEQGRRIADMELPAESAQLLRAYRFLSEMPMIHVLNVHEDALNSPRAAEAAASLGPTSVVIGARIEKEISELDPEERAEFLKGLQIGEPAAQRVVRAAYEALGLRSFFTGTDHGEELRAWTVHAGDTALTAAGKIHTDIARGFIRAEVADCATVLDCGGLKNARTQGKARLEGKEYVVKDGDVITFRFNV